MQIWLNAKKQKRRENRREKGTKVELCEAIFSHSTVKTSTAFTVGTITNDLICVIDLL